MARVYDYGRFRSTGRRLIDKFGTDAELRRMGSEPWGCRAVFDDYKNSQIDGTRVLQGDFIAYVPALGLGTTPKKGDALFWGGAQREVVAVKTIKPGPDEIIHILQMRGQR